MRSTLSAQRLPLIRLLLIMLALTRSIAALAQTTAPCEPSEPNCENSRFFQMALWTIPYHTGINWTNTAGYVDVPWFVSDNPAGQPPGRSIMEIVNWRMTDVSALSLDWSRILAVVIDEPYVTAFGDNSSTNPWCQFNSRRQVMFDVLGDLRRVADDVHDVAPRTRVWVNFHWWEINWIVDQSCPAELNDARFDVVSFDHYEDGFNDVLKGYYNWLAVHWPQQQVALVPGTFYQSFNFLERIFRTAMLSEYFAYANEMNRPCNMGLGRVGRTGNYDGCRVWIVAGWLSEPNFPSWAPEYYGILNPSVTEMRTAWQYQYSKVPRSGPRTLKDEELAVIQSLLE